MGGERASRVVICSDLQQRDTTAAHRWHLKGEKSRVWPLFSLEVAHLTDCQQSTRFGAVAREEVHRIAASPRNSTLEPFKGVKQQAAYRLISLCDAMRQRKDMPQEIRRDC